MHEWMHKIRSMPFCLKMQLYPDRDKLPEESRQSGWRAITTDQAILNADRTPGHMVNKC